MLEKLHIFSGEPCPCGKVHQTAVEKILVEAGAIKKLPACIRAYKAEKVFILADRNTFDAAGGAICDILEGEAIPYSRYIFEEEAPEPDEGSVGAAVMHFDKSCDLIIGVGSGVINDIGKILSHISAKPYFIVATAPSMDGYASATSSMSRDGLKVSLPAKCAEVIIGDTDILRKAPLRLLRAGLGDMLAKYISICEWRIAHLVTGEYYCERVAELVRQALRRCVENAEGLLKRETEAVEAVFEGLVLGGIAMAYAGTSRPASGVEHYFSHIWDMRGLAFGTRVDLHGIQCAVGTLLAARLYEQIKALRPDREKALAFVRAFDFAAWSEELRTFLGRGAETMIAQEEREQKYNPEKHTARLAVILESWDSVLKIINEEVPPADEIEALLETIGAPKTPGDIGIDCGTVPKTFEATKDIRDKYVLSRLVWDLGLMKELAF